MKSRIDECAHSGSPRTFRLMKLLFEMITVNLNKSTAMQDIGQLILKPYVITLCVTLTYSV